LAATSASSVPRGDGVDASVRLRQHADADEEPDRRVAVGGEVRRLAVLLVRADDDHVLAVATQLPDRRRRDDLRPLQRHRLAVHGLREHLVRHGVDRRHLRPVDDVHGPAGQRRPVGAPHVDVPIHRGGDDLERRRIVVQVDQHGRGDDAALQAVEAVARRALGEPGLGVDRKTRPSPALAVPDVDLAGERSATI
jgi:hypothetical protein